MKINWKEKYENESEKYWKLYGGCWDRSEKWAYAFLVTLATCFLIFVILALFGVFNSPIERLGLDKNELVREHILSYYPEFENCSIEYDECIDSHSFPCNKGVEIYCNKLDSRDNLRVQKNMEPTEVLYLEGITLEDILLKIIEGKYIVNTEIAEGYEWVFEDK